MEFKKVYLTVFKATLHNANAHDHEIVRAPETHPKDVPRKKKLNFVWSQAFKGSVETYTTRLSTKCYFIAILFMWDLLI